MALRGEPCPPPPPLFPGRAIFLRRVSVQMGTHLSLHAQALTQKRPEIGTSERLLQAEATGQQRATGLVLYPYIEL